MVARAKWEKFSAIFCNIFTKGKRLKIQCHCEPAPNNACHCEPVVLRAANQNLNDCQWQSYLSVAHAGVAPSGDSLRSQSVPLGSHSGGAVTK